MKKLTFISTALLVYFVIKILVYCRKLLSILRRTNFFFILLTITLWPNCFRGALTGKGEFKVTDHIFTDRILYEERDKKTSERLDSNKYIKNEAKQNDGSDKAKKCANM